MQYYKEIKNKLIENENYARIKDYSKERYKIQTYYEVGKLLSEAGNHYGEGIIKKYSEKLMNDINKKYNVRYLFDIRRLYYFLKVHPVGAFLSMSHYRILFSLKDKNEINYYINQTQSRNLSKRDLQRIIKDNEYKRLDEATKIKLINQEQPTIQESIKNPIILKSRKTFNKVTEKDLQNIILENIPLFLEELGNKFSFIKNEYKIKLGDRYNYIDILLFNYKFNCFVVAELKVVELSKEHIGQVQMYMNYIDRNIKTVSQNDTVGIIICKKNNEYVVDYCSNPNIFTTTYILKN